MSRGAERPSARTPLAASARGHLISRQDRDRHRRLVRHRRGDGAGAAGRGRPRRRRARRVERLETEIALELDVTDPESCERFVARGRRAARRPRHPRQQRRPRARPRAVRRVDRGGRAHRLRDERERARAHDAPLPAAHPRRRPHRQPGLGRRAAGVRERRDATSRRSSPCAASPTRCARICSAGRSASRPSTPASSRPSSRSSASRATRRRRRGLQGRRPAQARGHRRVHDVRADAAVARERRRDRRQGAQRSRRAAASSATHEPARRNRHADLPVALGFDAVAARRGPRVGRACSRFATRRADTGRSSRSTDC